MPESYKHYNEIRFYHNSPWSKGKLQTKVAAIFANEGAVGLCPVGGPLEEGGTSSSWVGGWTSFRLISQQLYLTLVKEPSPFLRSSSVGSPHTNTNALIGAS